jgi:hypothetical protein
MSVSISNGASFLKVLQDRCSGAVSISLELEMLSKRDP